MNYIDTRDLQKRLDELEDLETAYDEAKEAFVEAEDLMADDEIDMSKREDDLEDARGDLEDARDAFGPEEEEELEELRSLANQIGEFRHGETLIPEDEFEGYVQDLCQDCGYISSDFPWWIAIDWEETARNVSQDYTVVTYQGTDYYVRS